MESPLEQGIAQMLASGTQNGEVVEEEEPDGTEENEEENEREAGGEEGRTEEESEREDREEAEEEEESELTEREKALLARIEELSTPSVSKGEPVLPTLDVPDDETNEFIAEGDDVDEILSKPEALNKLLNKVYNRARSDAAKLAFEHSMKSLPAVTSTFVQKQVELYLNVAEFYRENADLNTAAGRRYMGTVSAQVLEKEPGISMEDLMKKSAERVRNVMGLSSQKPKSSVKKSPAFAKAQSPRKDKKGTELTPKEQEMLALIPK